MTRLYASLGPDVLGPLTALFHDPLFNLVLISAHLRSIEPKYLMFFYSNRRVMTDATVDYLPSCALSGFDRNQKDNVTISTAHRPWDSLLPELR